MSYIGAQPTTAAFITDQFNGTGSQTAFTLSVAPATTSSILVSVSGVLQDPTTYAVSGTTLTFSAAPPSGTGNISVRFLGIPASGVATTAYRTVTEFTATAGQTSFSVPSYTAGYINVYRNGALLGTSDYTATSGTTVVLANPASSGDLVVTESFFVSSVLNAIPAVANAVTTSYINNGAVTSAKLANLTTLPTSGGNITLPSVTGTAMVSGNMPAFSAYVGTNQVVSSGTYTKVACNVEEFDTASCYDTSTYRFTPNVAGYYQFNGQTENVTGGGLRIFVQFYKNGSEIKRGNDLGLPSGNWGNGGGMVANALVYCNGTTDYVEFYIYDTGGQTIAGGNSAVSYFQGFLVRTA